MAYGVLRVKEGAIGVMRVPVFSGRIHKRAPRSEALAPVVSNLYQAKRRTHRKAACKPRHHKRSRTKNRTCPQGGRLLAPQADASSYSKHGSDTDSQGGGL